MSFNSLLSDFWSGSLSSRRSSEEKPPQTLEETIRHEIKQRTSSGTLLPANNSRRQDGGRSPARPVGEVHGRGEDRERASERDREKDYGRDLTSMVGLSIKGTAAPVQSDASIIRRGQPAARKSNLSELAGRKRPPSPQITPLAVSQERRERLLREAREAREHWVDYLSDINDIENEEEILEELAEIGAYRSAMQFLDELNGTESELPRMTVANLDPEFTMSYNEFRTFLRLPEAADLVHGLQQFVKTFEQLNIAERMDDENPKRRPGNIIRHFVYGFMQQLERHSAYAKLRSCQERTCAPSIYTTSATVTDTTTCFVGLADLCAKIDREKGSGATETEADSTKVDGKTGRRNSGDLSELSNDHTKVNMFRASREEEEQSEDGDDHSGTRVKTGKREKGEYAPNTENREKENDGSHTRKAGTGVGERLSDCSEVSVAMSEAESSTPSRAHDAGETSSSSKYPWSHENGESKNQWGSDVDEEAQRTTQTSRRSQIPSQTMTVGPSNKGPSGKKDTQKDTETQDHTLRTGESDKPHRKGQETEVRQDEQSKEEAFRATMKECIEFFVMQKVYAVAFAMRAEDRNKDEEILSKTQSLEFVKPKHLDIEIKLGSVREQIEATGDEEMSSGINKRKSTESEYGQSQNEGKHVIPSNDERRIQSKTTEKDARTGSAHSQNMSKADKRRRKLWGKVLQGIHCMDFLKAPRAKIRCLLRISQLITKIHCGEHNEATFVGADDFLPVLIFALIEAYPRHLHRNLVYLDHYREEKELHRGELAYFYTNLHSAMEFICSIDSSSLSISEEEFERGIERVRARKQHKSEDQEEAEIERKFFPDMREKLCQRRSKVEKSKNDEALTALDIYRRRQQQLPSLYPPPSESLSEVYKSPSLRTSPLNANGQSAVYGVSGGPEPLLALSRSNAAQDIENAIETARVEDHGAAPRIGRFAQRSFDDLSLSDVPDLLQEYKTLLEWRRQQESAQG